MCTTDYGKTLIDKKNNIIHEMQHLFSQMHMFERTGRIFSHEKTTIDELRKIEDSIKITRIQFAKLNEECIKVMQRIAAHKDIFVPDSLNKLKGGKLI